jgi:nucleoside-diphosphate-sugar epimerase
MSQPRPTVLVLGARGRFGRAAARAFAEAGWRVHAQLRPGAQGPALPGVEWLPAHPHDTRALAAAARGAQVVVQGLSPAYTHAAWRAELPGLTQAAIDIASELGATLMVPANVYNFGAAMPAVLHEDTPQHPTTFKGRMRMEGELQVMRATQGGRMKAVAIRAGDFFGSGTGSWLDLVMAKSLAAGKFTYPGAYDVATSWAYLPDLARTFVAVAERRDSLPAFERLHFAGHHATGAEWARAITGIAREQGWLGADAPLRTGSVSWPLMRLVGLAIPTVSAVCEMRYLWRTPYALDNTQLRARIGAEPHTPFAQAVRAALGDLGMLRVDGSLPPQALALQ